MSLEKDYDNWVKSLMGGGKYAATPEQAAAASDAVSQMQAQLDAMAAAQKRQKNAADAMDAVQRAGAATAENVRKMSSDLTRSLRQDGLLGGTTAQPVNPAPAPTGSFDGLADKVRAQVLGQDAFVGAVVKAFRRPFVMGSGGDPSRARNLMLLCGPGGTGRHYALTCVVEEMAARGLLRSDRVENIDLSLYPGPAQEKLFLQDLYAALQSDAEVLTFDRYEGCAASYLTMLADLAIDGRLPLNSRYVLQRGILVDVGTALAPGAIGELQAAGKYFVFFSNKDESALAERFGARFVDALSGDICRTAERHRGAGAERSGPEGAQTVRPDAAHGRGCAGPAGGAVRQDQRHAGHAGLRGLRVPGAGGVCAGRRPGPRPGHRDRPAGGGGPSDGGGGRRRAF